jgi:hypothetical protein
LTGGASTRPGTGRFACPEPSNATVTFRAYPDFHLRVFPVLSGFLPKMIKFFISPPLLPGRRSTCGQGEGHLLAWQANPVWKLFSCQDCSIKRAPGRTLPSCQASRRRDVQRFHAVTAFCSSGPATPRFRNRRIPKFGCCAGQGLNTSQPRRISLYVQSSAVSL